MEFIHFIATENDNERRLDKIARRILKDESLSAIYKLIRKGFIKLNEKKQKPESIVFCGDKIQIATFLLNNKETSKKTNLIPKETEEIKIQVIFKNKYLRVINKPYDYSVQSGKKEKNLCDIISKSYYEENKNSSSLSFRPGALHRLDKKTTGLLVFSENLIGARWFSQALKANQIKKSYLAILEGHFNEKKLWCDSISNQRDKIKNGFYISKENEAGLKAITHVEPLSLGTYKNKPITLARIFIETGRKHQIRLHSSIHGHPLLGDTAYGGRKIWESQDFFLHCWTMELPKDNPLEIYETFICPIPLNFINMIKKHLPDFNIKSYNK